MIFVEDILNNELLETGRKPKVAFICVHNSCRSQMAEALGKYYAGEMFESYSAGTETHPKINPDAVRIIKQLYGIDMEKTQFSKRVDDLPPVDIVVTMGCGVNCPWLPAMHREDWGLEDPTGKEDDAFIATARAIEKKILDLKARIMSRNIGL
ncbi:MAG TPA: low molecular weight phosphatase family protein [Clostridiales bacterium]|nr:low molecular weight phosphatase family protein [Clostridiales bacterium]